MPSSELDPKPTLEPGAAKPDPGKRRLDVLLVEDNVDDALLLERHLRRNGFEPTITRIETSAVMCEVLALKRELQDVPRIVLADYNLPNFSGPEALGILKASGIDLPFIMMSGAISEEAAVESMRAGAQDYVTKQNLTRLVPAIEREVKEAEARRNRVAAEVALRASEARFHALVEAMPLGLLISEASGRVVYANGAVERMLGYSAAAVSVGSFAASGAVTLNSICPTLEGTIAEVLEEGTASPAPFEAVCVTATGENIAVLIGVALLNPDRSPQHRQVAAFIADLTLQKKSEEVLRRTEKLAVAGTFAASIAHEINNPLEAITNCLYLVAHGELTGDTRSYLETAQKELDRVAKITMQTLRFYRRSSRPQQTDLREVIDSVVDLMDRKLRQNEMRVERRFCDVPEVIAHEGEIRQVLANLIGNAIDAMPVAGRLVLRCAPAKDWTTGAPGVRVTVADTGTGMDPATQARIFDPFYSTKGMTGTGLGLWISKDIVEKHKGRLGVWSRKRSDTCPGGSVFTVFLPVEAGEAASW